MGGRGGRPHLGDQREASEVQGLGGGAGCLGWDEMGGRGGRPHLGDQREASEVQGLGGGAGCLGWDEMGGRGGRPHLGDQRALRCCMGRQIAGLSSVGSVSLPSFNGLI